MLVLTRKKDQGIDSIVPVPALVTQIQEQPEDLRAAIQLQCHITEDEAQAVVDLLAVQVADVAPVTVGFTIVKIKGSTVRIGVKAPMNVRIVRDELEHEDMRPLGERQYDANVPSHTWESKKPS